MRALSDIPKKDWATDGGYGENRRVLNSLIIKPEELEPHVNEMQRTYNEIAANEKKCEKFMTDDAEIVITAYGTVARIAKSAVDILREKGVKAGLFRPVTLYPFPKDALDKLAAAPSVKEFVAVELSMGQYVEDVKLVVEGRKPVRFFNRTGGNVMAPEDIVEFVMKEA